MGKCPEYSVGTEYGYTGYPGKNANPWWEWSGNAGMPSTPKALGGPAQPDRVHGLGNFFLTFQDNLPRSTGWMPWKSIIAPYLGRMSPDLVIMSNEYDRFHHYALNSISHGI